MPLCRTCDAAALSTSMSKNQPVPEGYVSACLFGLQDRPPKLAPTEPSPQPDGPPRGAGTSTTTGRVAPPPQLPVTPAPPAVNTSPPTVRHAVEAYLASAPDDADSSALLLLGAHFGPSTRLDRLNDPATAGSLARWFDERWRSGSKRQAALRTVIGVVDFWRANGWLTGDPAAALR